MAHPSPSAKSPDTAVSAAGNALHERAEACHVIDKRGDWYLRGGYFATFLRISNTSYLAESSAFKLSRSARAKR